MQNLTRHIGRLEVVVCPDLRRLLRDPLGELFQVVEGSVCVAVVEQPQSVLELVVRHRLHAEVGVRQLLHVF